jgi:PAS domain S-box-containing protein
VLLLVSIPVVFELGMVGVLYGLVSQARDDRRKADYSQEVVSLLNTALIAHIERMQLLYLSKAGVSTQIPEKAHQLAAKSGKAIIKVEQLAAANPGESAAFNKIAGLLRSISGKIITVNNFYTQGDKARAAQEWILMQGRIDQIMELSDEFFLEQKKFQGESQEALENKEKAITSALYASILISILTAFGLAVFFNRSTSDRLQIIMDNTSRIAAGKPPLGQLSGNDELTRIDRLYHQMYEDMLSLREKERALLDNAAELICSIDSSMRISDINLSAKTILGMPPEDLIGLRVLDLVENQHQEGIGAQLERAFDNQEPSRFDAKMRRADGTIIDTEWVATGSANAQALYCVILDVTQRKQIEQMRRDFVAMVSHDLRTPLNSIQMTLSITQEEAQLGESLSADALEGLTIAQNSASRLLALVNNLLDLEKLESGQFELLARERALYPVLEEAVGSVSMLAQQMKIVINLEAARDTQAYFDDERVMQVVINLISNAIKFSPRSSTITVTAKSTGDFVRLTIADQGRGIPEQLRGQIFERFRQVLPQDQYVMKGSGLGLAICKSIVERHMGNIGVQSVESQGSTFWFTLPATKSIFIRLEEVSGSPATG